MNVQFNVVNHHPSDDVLMAYAAGNLDEATSLLIATHLTLCPECRHAVELAESLGGELLEEVEASPLQANAIDKMLAAIENETAANDDTAPVRLNGSIPSPLAAYIGAAMEDADWRWVGPGVKYADIKVSGSGPSVGLLKIAPSTEMPQHGHTADEMTMVLAGGYTDTHGSYKRGDVEIADDGVVHQPVADAGEECICLIVRHGTMRPTGLVARVFQSFMKF